MIERSKNVPAHDNPARQGKAVAAKMVGQDAADRNDAGVCLLGMLAIHGDSGSFSFESKIRDTRG